MSSRLLFFPTVLSRCTLTDSIDNGDVVNSNVACVRMSTNPLEGNLSKNKTTLNGLSGLNRKPTYNGALRGTVF